MSPVLLFWILLGGAGFLIRIRWKGLFSRVLSGMALAGLLFSMFFARNPVRIPPACPGCIVSPADGRIVSVEDSVQGLNGLGPYRKIAVFLSIWDVHINRIPCDGRVTGVRHVPGGFMPARNRRSGEANERMWTVLETRHGTIMIKQVAGIVARRIVSHLEPGDTVGIGETFGMIRFGSRVELYLPDDCRIRVRPGDRVKAGVTLVAQCD